MRGVMKQIGDAPGLLSRLPGIKQLFQLRQMQGKGMEDVLGAEAGDVSERCRAAASTRAARRADGGHAEGLPAARCPRARWLAPGSWATRRSRSPRPRRAADRERRKKKRKQERQARKKNRKKNKR